MVTTWNDIYRRGKKALADFPSCECRLLFEKAGGPSREDMPRLGGEACESGAGDRLKSLIKRRLAGEPLQYILGEWEFMGLPIKVGPGVLIPRPETEQLAELAIEHARMTDAPYLLDLCAGSGCIAAAAAKALPHSRVWAVELSLNAFPYLEGNMRALGLTNVRPVLGDATELPGEIKELRFDVITCNPPYIAAAEMDALQPEVKREPEMALLGGEDGLDFYRALPAECLELLKKGGRLIFETGCGQGEAVAAILRGCGYAGVEIMKDLAGLDRIVTGIREKE